MNALVFGALAEVQVAVLRCLIFHGKEFQPIVESGTFLFAARCFLPQKYFSVRQRTVRKQGMNKISPSRWLTMASCDAWKPKMHDDVMLNGVLYSLFIICC